MKRIANSQLRAHSWKWIALAVLLISPISVARAANPFDPSPALGHAEVVAQGAVSIPGPNVVWRLVDRVAEPRDTAKASKQVLGFVVPIDGAVLLTDMTADGPVEAARVAPGEFYLVRQNTQQIRASLTGKPLHYLTLELVASTKADDLAGGTLVAQSDAFKAPSGERDVDLVAITMNPGESGTVPDSDQPVLICVTSGTIRIKPEKDRATTITLGQFTLLDKVGQMRVSPDTGQIGSSSGDLSAGYVAAVFGPEIDPSK